MKGKRAEDKPIDVTPAAPDEPAGKPAEAAAPLKTYERITCTESVKHTYTMAELAELADQMGAAASRVFQIEIEKAERAAHYAALLKEANRAHAELVNKFVQRYEMRDVECRVEFDTPEAGYKSFVRLDSGVSIREVRMTEAEKQRAFVFDAGDGKPQ
jgi:hypothetical protein